MRFDEIDGEDIEDPGLLSALGRKLRQGINPFWDEMAGAGTAWKDAASKALDGRLATPGETLDSYRRGRDESRAADDVAELYHPTASKAAELAGAVVQGVATPGSTLGKVVAGGAATGAAQGLGASRAELTGADLDEYLRATLDVGAGAGLGGVFGAGGHAVGKGLRWLGEKGSAALSRARGTMVAEEGEALAREAAEREAPELARRAEQAATMDKAQGQAMEMDKALQKRAARESDRAASARTQVLPSMQEPRVAASRRGPAPGGSADPNDTAVLRGYQGSAGERRAVNYDRVQGYRRALEDPGLPEAQRARLQRYIDSYGDAVDDPGAFERRRIEQELRKRFPGEDVDRIMRERVGPDGSIRSRAELDEVTQPGDMGDVARQGRAEQVRRLGGGGSAWEQAPVTKTELVPREMSEDPTRMALIRTSPDEGIPGLTESGPLHTFEFKPQGSDEIFEVLATEPTPGVINVDTVKPVRAASVDELHGEMKNTLGPRAMRDMLAELARAFPGAKRVVGDRMTGANVGHVMDVRAPEVTQRMDLSDVARQGRAEDLRRMGGGGSAWEDMAAPMDVIDEVTDVSQALRSPVAPRPVQRLAPGAEQAEGFFRERPMPGAPVQPPPPAGQPTRAGRPTAPPPAPAPSPGPGTRVERPRPAPAAAAPPAPPATPPRPILGAEDLVGLQQYLDEVATPGGNAQARASAREAKALGDVARAGYEGVRGASNTLGAMLGGGVAITREGLRSPAVRARALAALHVDTLAKLDPATFARVGRSLEAALQAGQDEYASAVHVLNQTDPEFQAASRRAEEAVKDVDDEQLAETLRAAGYLR